MRGVYDGSRAEKIFTDEMEAKFVGGARSDMASALTLAIAIGQRPSDVLSLPWERYDGTYVWVLQGKTKRFGPGSASRRGPAHAGYDAAQGGHHTHQSRWCFLDLRWVLGRLQR